jgi:hypothetical protein
MNFCSWKKNACKNIFAEFYECEAAPLRVLDYAGQHIVALEPVLSSNQKTLSSVLAEIAADTDNTDHVIDFSDNCITNSGVDQLADACEDREGT